MKLLIDIGNTSCKIAVACRGEIGKTFTFGGRDIAGFIEKKVRKELKYESPSTVVVSNVRKDDPELLEYLGTICTGKVVNLDAQTVGYLVQNGGTKFEVLENMPEGMGADREAAILAANIIFPEDDLILFDFGTATTVEYIDAAKDNPQDGRKKAFYLGGTISLGLNTRYKALAHYTQKIPLLSPNVYLENHKIQNISSIGFDLDTALAGGNILGIIFEIEGYIARHPKRRVIFTGGDAFYFAESIKKPIFVICNLVLMGLLEIADFFETR